MTRSVEAEASPEGDHVEIVGSAGQFPSREEESSSSCPSVLPQPGALVPALHVTCDREYISMEMSRCGISERTAPTLLTEEACELPLPNVQDSRASPTGLCCGEGNSSGADDSLVKQNSSTPRKNDKDDLISGLPNDITVDKIISRLPRKSLNTVSYLNRAWRRAFLSGQVYDAQIRIGNVEACIVVLNSFPKPGDIHVRAISLYDPSQESWHLLPPVPDDEEGIPYGCRCIVVKGKLYLMGGFRRSPANLMCDAIFVFDLGCYHGGWKRCGSMEFSREEFSLLLYDDGIYVFGGWDLVHDMSREVSVYHPQQDRWTKLPDMPHRRCEGKVLVVGGGFWLYGGFFWSDEEEPLEEGSNLRNHFKKTEMEKWTDMYDSNKGEWRKVPNFTYGRPRGEYVSVEGNIYHVTCDHIDLFDLPTTSWKRSRINLWSVLEKLDVRALWPTAAMFADGELYILLEVEDRNHYTNFRVIPMKSVGFTANCSGAGGCHGGITPDKILVWQQIACPLGFGVFGERNPSIQSIQLPAWHEVYR